MKTIFISIYFILLFQFSYGQFGLLSHDSLIWQQRTYYTSGPSGPGQGLQYFYTFNNYYLRGDTIIGNQVFRKLFTSNSTSSLLDVSTLTFDAYILEDSNRVYKKTPTSLIKVLDYNLQVSDSFQFAGLNSKLVLLSIDSTIVNGNYYKRFNFEKGVKWIKGVGDVVYGATFGSYYFLDPSPFWWMLRGSELRCYSENYSPTIGNNCNLFAGVSRFNLNATSSIFPNPAQNDLTISIYSKHSKFNSATFEIYSLLGFKIKSGLLRNKNNEGFSSTSISLKDISDGVYLVKILNENEVITSKQFIKVGSN